MKNLYKIILTLFSFVLLFNISSALLACPGDAGLANWTSNASGCNSSLERSETSTINPNTGGASSGNIYTDINGNQWILNQGNDGLYSITCNGTTGSDTLTFKSLTSCNSNPVEFCAPIGNADAGYMWVKYSYSGFTDEYAAKGGSNSITCNPCNTGAGEVWNGISGSGATCVIPQASASMTISDNVVSGSETNFYLIISCTNSNAFTLKYGTTTVHSGSAGSIGVINDTYVLPNSVDFSRVYNLACSNGINSNNISRVVTNVKYCAMRDDANQDNKGYMWSRIISNGVADKYSAVNPAATCNPCYTSEGETWNNVSGSGAVCAAPITPSANIDISDNVLSLSCTNSNSFILKQGTTTVHSGTSGSIGDINSTYTVPNNLDFNNRTYSLNCYKDLLVNTDSIVLNNLKYCVMKASIYPQNAGYRWSEITVGGSEYYSVVSPQETCNPCNIGVGEIWNNVSGSGAVCASGIGNPCDTAAGETWKENTMSMPGACYVKPTGSLNVATGTSILNITCTDSNSYILKNRAGVTVKTETQSPIGIINSTFTSTQNGQKYTLVCNRVHTLGNTNVNSVPVDFEFTKLYSDFPDSYNGKNSLTGDGVGAKTKTYPNINLSCPDGKTAVIYKGSTPLTDIAETSSHEDSDLTLTSNSQDIQYNAECLSGGISSGKVYLDVELPQKITVIPNPVIYKKEINTDISITWRSNGNSCDIYSWNNVDLLVTNDNITKTQKDTITGIGYDIKNYEYQYIMTPANFTELLNPHLGAEALGYNIKCQDTNYVSRQEGGPVKITVETYNPSLTNVDPQPPIPPGEPVDVKFSCTPQFDYVNIEKYNGYSWSSVTGYPKQYPSVQNQKFETTINSSILGTNYRLICKLGNIIDNRTCENYPSMDGCTPPPCVGACNPSGEIVVWGSCDNTSCSGYISNTNSSSCNVDITGITSPSPATIGSGDGSVTYDLPLDQTSWIISCDSETFELANPFKSLPKVKSFDISPRELPCLGGNVKVSWNIEDINGGYCTLTDKNTIDNPISSNGSGSAVYNISYKKKIDFICYKDANSDGDHDDEGESITYTRYAIPACIGER